LPLRDQQPLARLNQRIDAGSEAFVIDRRRNVLRGIKDLERQCLLAIPELDASIAVGDDVDLLPAQGITGRPAGLDDVALASEGDHEILGEAAAMVDGTQARQFLAASGKGQVSVFGVLCLDREAGVVLGKVPRQLGIGRFDVGDARQAHRLDQAILQGLKQSFHPSLGLWGERLEGGDPQGAGGPLKLGGLGIFRVVLGKDAVAVAVEGDRALVKPDVLLQQGKRLGCSPPARSAPTSPGWWHRR